jgi:hypothetical protein
MSNVASLGIAILHWGFLMFTDILSNLAKDEREFDEA